MEAKGVFIILSIVILIGFGIAGYLILTSQGSNKDIGPDAGNPKNNGCFENQIKHQGLCKPKIIELNDDYAHPEAYLPGHMAGDKTNYNFNYQPLVDKVQELVRNKSSNMEKIIAISNWVYNSKYYSYGASQEGGLPTLWNNQYGVCNDAARITVAMLNKAGIPSLFNFVNYRGLPHAATIFNVDGVWGAVDTTFHKSSLQDSNRDVFMSSIDGMKKRVYITIDEEGFIFNGQKNQYCNIKEMVCSDKPFSSLKIFIHPSILTTDIYYPAEDNIIIPEFTGGPTKYRFHCGLKINNISCGGNGCGFDMSDPDYDTLFSKAIKDNRYIPEFGDYLFPFSYGESYLPNEEPLTKVGYIHMKMPKHETLSYDYYCADLLDNDKIIAKKSGDLNVENPIIIKWDNLEKTDDSSQEGFDALINHLKSLTEGLGINI